MLDCPNCDTSDGVSQGPSLISNGFRPDPPISQWGCPGHGARLWEEAEVCSPSCLSSGLLGLYLYQKEAFVTPT